MAWAIVRQPKNVPPKDPGTERWRYLIRFDDDVRRCDVIIPKDLFVSTPVPVTARYKGRPTLEDVLAGRGADNSPTEIRIRADGYDVT
jgi:hypothetical protein